jgi:DNA-binding transcriptional MerR regulator
MAGSHMGSIRDEGAVVPLADAAGMLGVHERTVRQWVRRGVLRPLYRGKRLFFALPDVTALADLGGERLSLDALAKLAHVADARSRSVELRVRELYDVLGLSRAELDRSEAAVLECFDDATDALESDDALTSPQRRQWADRFFGIDEGYLQLVERFTRCAEPWRVYIDLGTRLAAEARAVEGGGIATELRYLDAARAHLRHVGYFYCRASRGQTVAKAVFGSGSLGERMVRLMGL